MPSGLCIHIRQIPPTHVTYITRIAIHISILVLVLFLVHVLPTQFDQEYCLLCHISTKYSCIESIREDIEISNL